MASVFGDDDVNNLFNDNLDENQDLPSDDDHDDNDGHKENLFGEENIEEDVNAKQEPVKIEPKKRSVRNPRLRLTIETLCGPRGIHTIEEYFKDVKFKGKGYEKNDLDEIMRRLQHWGHRMYPTYKFDDILTNIERLGKKKALQVHMSRYRLGMLENLKALQMNNVEEEDEDAEDAAVDEPFDEFDALLGEQIAISRMVPRTPNTNNSPRQLSANKSSDRNTTYNTPYLERIKGPTSTPYTNIQNVDNISELATPLPQSQPAPPEPDLNPISQQPTKLTAEQLATIAENRRLAQERLRARKLNQ